jgi:hypothetical protein
MKVESFEGSRASRERAPECGDASACLKLRIPVTRRDRPGMVQNMYPYEIAWIAPKNATSRTNVHRRGQ